MDVRSKKIIYDEELKDVAGGRKWRENEQADYKDTFGKCMEVYGKLLDAGRAEEARDFVALFTKLSGDIYADIWSSEDNSQDFLFSKYMESHWPNV